MPCTMFSRQPALSLCVCPYTTTPCDTAFAVGVTDSQRLGVSAMKSASTTFER